MKDELERRIAKENVPRDLHVYELCPHDSDEGGPRPFAPVKEMQNLDQDDDKFDRALWPTLFDAALRHGTPIELARDDSPIYRNARTPPADICEWGYGVNHLLILSERANDILAPFLQTTSNVVPVTCASEKLFGYHLTAIDDVLDVPKCNADWMTRKGVKTCTYMTRYAFKTELLGQSPFFTTPQNPSQILVLQPVVDAILKQQLTGYHCKRVWPHVAMPLVVTIDVKTLPRAKRSSTRQPTYSTSAVTIDPTLITAAMGLLSSHDRRISFDVVAYQLPDISFPSGAIVAADLLLTEGRPFARRVAPGKYPVILIAARLSGSDERIAFAVVQFAKRPATSWQPAYIESAPGKPPRKRPTNAYPVESGAGAFCSPELQDQFLSMADPTSTLMHRIQKEMTRSYQHTRCWVHIETNVGSAAIFSSGVGDGSYASYFGLDEAGEPSVLLTDFGVLNWARRA